MDSSLRDTLTDSQRRAQPQIIFALVIRSRKVALAHYEEREGNFMQATMQALEKFKGTDKQKSYAYGEHAFHYTVQEGSDLWFVCVADKSLSRKTSFGFLKSVQDAFEEKYTAPQADAGLEEGMQQEFSADLKQLMETYNSGKLDRVAQAMETVQGINENLVESLHQLLERQEKIDLLVERSQSLAGESQSFRRQTQQLEWNVRWKKVRRMVICGLVVLIVILVIVMMNCGMSLQCR